MDMPRVTEYNDGYRYVLLSYDSYSKFLTAIPMKSKTTDSLLAAIDYLMETLPFAIHRVYSDKEAGLMSRPFKLWFRQHNVIHFTTTSKVKAPSVERCIRTLRNALQRYFEDTKSWRWIDFLPIFVNHYNNRKHSTTGLRPWDVVIDPTLIVPHGHLPPMDHPPKLPPIGSFVRISRLRSPFEKEASGTWSREVFKVTAHRLGQRVPMVSLQDLTGADIQGNFYPDEVQSIDWKDEKRVSEVHDLKELPNGRFRTLVSFEGYPSKYLEWIE
jgi:hypothetical protein